MEPITLMVMLAPLLIDYARERRDGKKMGLEDFNNWLKENHSGDVLKAIKNNQLLGIKINALLSEHHTVVQEKLDKIEKQLVFIIANNSSTREIATSINAQSGLSEQALNILRQMNEADASKFMELKSLNDTRFQFMGSGSGGKLDLDESRFIDDDLTTLVNARMLIPEINSQGYRLFTITRLGASIVS